MLSVWLRYPIETSWPMCSDGLNGALSADLRGCPEMMHVTSFFGFTLAVIIPGALVIDQNRSLSSFEKLPYNVELSVVGFIAPERMRASLQADFAKGGKSRSTIT